MTFTEAALEVLRSVGKPLHYKKITEIAIERNLLSHVGKTPETTMSSRLATMVKKDRGDAPIVKVKPGVFALRDGAQPADDEEADSTPPEADAPEGLETSEATEDERAGSEPPADEPSPAAAELPGADVFPEEDDDDELILANLDEEAREGKRTRKRRPRRRRDRDEAGSASESRSERRGGSRGRTRREREAPATRAADAGESVGRDLSDAIETALRNRSRQPRTLHQVAERLIDGGRLSGSASTLAPTLAAAVRGDNAKRQSTGRRPRFREADGQISLLEWDLPNEAVNAERDAVRAADRQRQGIRRALIKRLRDLPDGALLELLATWLNAVGVHSLRAVRADAGDFNLAGTLRRGPEETPLAISIYRGRKPVDKEAIVALRGGLHHFDHARIGWVVTLGAVADGTTEEGHAEGAAPCALFDGDALAASMEEIGVGITRISLPLALLDLDLLDSLGAGASRASTSASEESSESNGTRRRKSRRRGRRRGGRDDEAADEASQDEPVEAREESQDSEPAAPESTESEESSASSGETSEDIEKTTTDEPAEAGAETERL